MVRVRNDSKEFTNLFYEQIHKTGKTSLIDGRRFGNGAVHEAGYARQLHFAGSKPQKVESPVHSANPVPLHVLETASPEAMVYLP